MVYFSRCGMLRGQTMIQGKMAKKKSTKMVETVWGPVNKLQQSGE
jgi:hypothetical protein